MDYLNISCVLYHSYPKKPETTEEVYNETKQRWEIWKFYKCKKCGNFKILKSIKDE